MLAKHQEKERRVIAKVIESIEAGIRGDESAKSTALARAKEFLLEGG